MKKAVHVYYSGQVQGVGFRYNARRLAEASGVTGWVRNLPDGRVELLAEADEAALRKFLAAIKTGMGHYDFTQDATWQESTEQSEVFEIRF
jgi:acylphosphatase